MTEAIVVAVVGFVGSVITNAFFYGRLTQKVKDQGEQLDEVDARSSATALLLANTRGQLGLNGK